MNPREVFEKWMRNRLPHVRLTKSPDGKYANWTRQGQWEAWQAALASQPDVAKLRRALEAVLPHLPTEAEMLDEASLNEGRASEWAMLGVKVRRALSSTAPSEVEKLHKAVRQAINKGGITIERWADGRLHIRAFGHPEGAEIYPELASYLSDHYKLDFDYQEVASTGEEKTV